MGSHKMLPFPTAPALRPVGPQLAPSGATSGDDRFLHGMLEIPSDENRSRNPLKMVASVVIHTAVIALLLIVPVYYATNTISLKTLTPTYVFTPPPPAPPPPPAAAKAPQAPQVTPKIVQPTFVAPKVVPKQVPSEQAAVAAPQMDDSAILGGVAGGVPGGVVGGLLGGTGTAPGPPAPPKQDIVRVGGNVKAPALLQKIQPEYPPVAKSAHVEGTVVIDAVIDKNGNVMSEHAVSGPGLLIPAALNAVHQWKYSPTYLNGQPVDLAMQVTVDFKLG
jgi:periplasmic protein TonB